MLVYAASNINRLNHGICQLTARLQLVAGVQYFSCHVKRLRYVLLCSNAIRLQYNDRGRIPHLHLIPLLIVFSERELTVCEDAETAGSERRDGSVQRDRRTTCSTTLRYFTEIGKHALQHITASSRIELIDRKSAFITQTPVKFACVTKCTHSRWTRSLLAALLTSNLSFNFRLTVTFLVLMLGFRFTLWRNLCAS